MVWVPLVRVGVLPQPAVAANPVAADPAAVDPAAAETPGVSNAPARIPAPTSVITYSIPRRQECLSLSVRLMADIFGLSRHEFRGWKPMSAAQTVTPHNGGS